MVSMQGKAILLLHDCDSSFDYFAEKQLYYLLSEKLDPDGLLIIVQTKSLLEIK